MDTYGSTQDLVNKFNAKDRQARKYIFTISNAQLLALYAYLLGMGTPLMMIDANNDKDFLLISRRIWRVPYAKLAQDETDIPAAVANQVKQVLMTFFGLLPLTLAVFEKYYANYSTELGEMEISTQNQFVKYALGIYLSSFRGGKTHETLTGDDYATQLEKTVSSCLANLPTMRGLRNNDHRIVSRLLDPSCDYSISKSLWGVFESCCRTYKKSLLHLDGGMYYDFDVKRKDYKAMNDAFLTFQSESMLIIWDSRFKLSLRVPNIKTYLDTIVRDNIVDRITRGSATRTAASYKTVGDTSRLDNAEEAKLEFERPEPLDEKTLNDFKAHLFRAAEIQQRKLSDAQLDLCEYMIRTGETKPRNIAKNLGVEDRVSNITTEKSRTKAKLLAVVLSPMGRRLREYYGVKY